MLDYGDDGQRNQKCVKKAVSEERGLTWTILPEFQPNNQVWTLLCQYGLRTACKDFNQTMKFGHRLHKSDEEEERGFTETRRLREPFC